MRFHAIENSVAMERGFSRVGRYYFFGSLLDEFSIVLEVKGRKNL